MELSTPIFIDPESKLLVDISEPIGIELPPQIGSEAVSNFLSISSTTAKLGISAITLNTIKDIALGQSLKSVWNMINCLQFVIFLTDLNVRLVAHATEFLKQLRIIALGEFIPYEWLTSSIRSWFDEGDDSASDSDDYLDEFGSLLVIALAMSITIVIVLVILKFKETVGEKISALAAKLKAKLFWNTFIRFSF